ncbi:M1 family metallopeptidase [Falsibacillus pallidus]|uniref:M1 family metallopeptidase n=1 Tax=Falsibacillus pallidus TaxID=493781 RepID=UPI001313FC70|nr:M1 family metallopeptidase [Falsibacillus pallidus]
MRNKSVVLAILASVLLYGCSEEKVISTKAAKPAVENTEEKKDKPEENTKAPSEKGESKNELEAAANFQYPRYEERAIDTTSSFENIKTLKPDTVQNQNKAAYDIQLQMNPDGKFEANANIEVENLSSEDWSEILFYFIPNAFTEKNKPVFMNHASDVKITQVELDGKSVPFQLAFDTLLLPLDSPFLKNTKKAVTVKYSFTVPEMGARFSKEKDNYYLAQWYPMLATYHAGWVKGNYTPVSESYHTDFSSFQISYDLPDEYNIFSSSDNDPKTSSKKGTLTLDKSKEFFLGLTKNMVSKSTTVDGIEIRVTAFPENKDKVDEALTAAKKAMHFFNQIGPYQHKQVDIILDEGGMEYPGIVTASRGDGLDGIDFVVAHEMAHQWFYGTVSNNPFIDAYIDEGMTSFATYLFMMTQTKEAPESVFQSAKDRDEQVIMDKKREILLAHTPVTEFLNGNWTVNTYDVPSFKLWELTGDLTSAQAFLKKYYETYAYQTVDSKEYIRFLKAYFQLKDNTFFENWIKLD